MRFSVLLLLFIGVASADEISEAKKRWAESPHGPLLERILPPSFDVAQLPERESRGAKLTTTYCVQCHNLPNPAMHDAARWPGVVRRMVPRMEGKGNLGKLMADMMAGVRSPSDEEERIISPAILMAREQGIDATGPYPPDTIFMRARDGHFDAVVAMYHDQGLIPVKLLAFDQAVNVTLGLPIIRTSPDHGTAFDIVGRNKANPGSMRAAIELAINLAVKRHDRGQQISDPSIHKSA